MGVISLLILSLTVGMCSSLGRFSSTCSPDRVQVEVAGGQPLPLCPGSMLRNMRTAHRETNGGPLVFPGGCGFHWFSSDTACQLLSKHPTTFIFIGDSVVRHWMHGMQIILRGDYYLGALTEQLPENASKACTCDRQFTVKACRQHILKDTASLQNHQPCSGATRVAYFGATNEQEINFTQVITFARQQQPRHSVLLLGGWGLHNSLLATPVFKSLVRRLWGQSEPLRLLCVGIHALGDNVQAQFRKHQNNVKVQKYNMQLDRLCQGLRIPFFDLFAATLNAPSWDGIHYGLAINVLKAQLLLNYLPELL